MNSRISPANRRVWDAIVKFKRERGYPPTIRELCEMTGLTSTSTVHAHMDKLIAAGLVERPAKAHIAYRVNEPGRTYCPHCGGVIAGVKG